MIQYLILLISIYYLDLTCDVIPPRRFSGTQHSYVLIHLSFRPYNTVALEK